jgi:hypothetical protein
MQGLADRKRFKSLLTCRETRLRRQFMFLATTRLELEWALKDKKLSISISPIPHVKDCSTHPRNRVLQGWLGLSGTFFSGGRGYDEAAAIVFSATELLAEDVFTEVLARYVLNACHSIECKEAKGVILTGNVYSQTFHA